MKFENSTVKVFGAFALVILVVLGFIRSGITQSKRQNYKIE